ncbi:hypothetical protein [Vacuolonema iberomarrocanum]|uniref:hypothetical protein n=1 Tax=Vacuolonema iberomarrocanum TaxID=3454632 RepID=UPI001A046AF0|nr:hypothetical protein [filamentous cyanobacterium LEGE 07170]
MKRTKIAPERSDGNGAIAPPGLAPLTSDVQRRLAVLQRLELYRDHLSYRIALMRGDRRSEGALLRRGDQLLSG